MLIFETKNIFLSKLTNCITLYIIYIMIYTVYSILHNNLIFSATTDRVGMSGPAGPNLEWIVMFIIIKKVL